MLVMEVLTSQTINASAGLRSAAHCMIYNTYYDWLQSLRMRPFSPLGWQVYYWQILYFSNNYSTDKIQGRMSADYVLYEPNATHHGTHHVPLISVLCCSTSCPRSQLGLAVRVLEDKAKPARMQPLCCLRWKTL